jgi:anti-sigma factor RsiW
MTCEEARILVHALADGELDAGHAREVEAHVAQCVACAAELAAARVMKERLRAAPLGFAVPASLTAKIDRVVPTPLPVTNRRALLKGFAAGGIASALAAASVGLVILRETQGDRILGEAISAHLRSLQADHLTDVLSTDQHTVKPWFNGRIDLAPPVIDLTAQGFTLIGGRLDYIDGKPAAALVYRRRIHVINLFVAQGLGEAPSTPKLTMMQGFNLLRWNENGLNMLAVSDLNRDELEEFGSKFSAAARAAAQS